MTNDQAPFPGNPEKVGETGLPGEGFYNNHMLDMLRDHTPSKTIVEYSPTEIRKLADNAGVAYLDFYNVTIIRETALGLHPNLTTKQLLSSYSSLMRSFINPLNGPVVSELYELLGLYTFPSEKAMVGFNLLFAQALSKIDAPIEIVMKFIEFAREEERLERRNRS